MGDVHPAAVKAELCEQLSRITFERWGWELARRSFATPDRRRVEAALKTALLHSGRAGVISFQGGFHGLGLGAPEVIGISTFREPFQSQLGRFAVQLPYPNCFRCPFGRSEGFRLEGNPFPNCSTSCLEELQKQIKAAIRQREIGSIIVEPIQGAGGEIVPPRDFLRMLRHICDEEKLLLIVDEIYTGFESEPESSSLAIILISRPDIICLAKALSGVSHSLLVSAARTSWMPGRNQAAKPCIPARRWEILSAAPCLASIAEHLKEETQQLARRAGRCFDDRCSPELALDRLRSRRRSNARRRTRETGWLAYGALAAAIMRRGLQDGLILLGGGPAGAVLSFAPPLSSPKWNEFLATKLADYLAFLPGSIS